MFSQTLDQVRARLVDEGGLFVADRDTRLLRSALGDVLRKLGTYRLCGHPKTATLPSVNGLLRLPDDFVAFAGADVPFKTVGMGMVSVPCEGDYCVHYYGYPLDEDGVPLVHDLLVEPLMLWVEYKIIKLLRDHKLAGDVAARAITYAEVRDRERLALDAIASARGEANMLTEAEVQRLINYTQARPYQNRKTSYP